MKAFRNHFNPTRVASAVAHTLTDRAAAPVADAARDMGRHLARLARTVARRFQRQHPQAVFVATVNVAPIHPEQGSAFPVEKQLRDDQSESWVSSAAPEEEDKQPELRFSPLLVVPEAPKPVEELVVFDGVNTYCAHVTFSAVLKGPETNADGLPSQQKMALKQLDEHMNELASYTARKSADRQAFNRTRVPELMNMMTSLVESLGSNPDLAPVVKGWAAYSRVLGEELEYVQKAETN